MGAAMSEIATVIDATQERFKKIAPASVNYESEKGFAIQLLRNNTFLGQVAKNNPASLQQALTNVAAIGLSLNPAKKQAYLITRNIKVGNKYEQRVFLEPSYMGLCDLATQSGCIEWVQAYVVRDKDNYLNKGPGEKPEHTYNSFGDRGAIVGVYCVAKTSGGDYLVSEMDKAKIDSVMERSESIKSARKKGKQPYGPWVTDYEEMAKKTVIRNAFKTWPKAKELERLEQAVHISNDNEGFEPILTAPDLGGFTTELKSYFDQLIEQSKAIEMYVLRETEKESVFTDLYHSFKDGVKGKYQRAVESLLKSGAAQFDDCLFQVAEGLQLNDDVAVQEALEGLSDETLQLIKGRLSAEHRQMFEEVTECEN